MSTERQESKLIRNIGFWPLMGIAYGQIIGAGIMTQTGIAIGMTGTGVVLAYIISAVCTTFQNFPTAILGATVPVSGGEYRYISRLRGKKWGFVYLATYVVSKLTIALYALSCASYLVAFLTGISEQIIAILPAGLLPSPSTCSAPSSPLSLPPVSLPCCSWVWHSSCSMVFPRRILPMYSIPPT